MAVSTVTPVPKAQPDVSKINGFNGCIVTCTKHQAIRNSPGSLVVPTQQMTAKQLFELTTTVPLREGPGFYLWNVTDAGGTGDDTWMTKFGGDIPAEAPMAGPMNGAGFPSMPAGSAAPMGEGIVNMGHGFFYNETLGTITTPWRTVHNWKPGEDLPRAPASPAGQQQAASTPWGGQATGWNPAFAGWGSFPATASEGDSKQVSELKAQLAEERRAREMRDLREDTNKRFDDQRRETREMFERITSAITAKPAGPSEELLEMRRRNEALERQVADEKRERESADRDARLREDMRRQDEKMERMFRELAEANRDKSDPMLPMLMQMITQSQSSAMEVVKVIQATTAGASTAAERQTQQLVAQLQSTVMNPMQLMQLVQSAKGEGADSMRFMSDNFRGLMDTQRQVFEQLLDVAGQGGQPAWLSAVEKALDKIGSVGQIMAARQQQQQQPQRVVRVVQQQPIVTPAPPPAPPGIAPPPGAPPGTPAPASTAPTEIRNTPTNNVVPITRPREKGGRRARAEGRSMPPPADPSKGYTIEELRAIDPEDIEEGLRPLADEAFFGEIWQYIPMIRENHKSGMKPEGIAELLLRARESFGKLKVYPPAVQLYMADHIEVLIDRLLPDADEEYRDEVVDIIEDQIERESEGTTGS